MKIHSTTVSQKRMKMIKPQSVPLIFDGNTIITVIVFVAFYDTIKGNPTLQHKGTFTDTGIT